MEAAAPGAINDAALGDLHAGCPEIDLGDAFLGPPINDAALGDLDAGFPDIDLPSLGDACLGPPRNDGQAASGGSASPKVLRGAQNPCLARDMLGTKLNAPA